MQPAIKAEIKLTQKMPPILAQPLSQLDDWLYPISNHGKPVKNQLRNHSPKTQSEGKTSIRTLEFLEICPQITNGMEFKQVNKRQKRNVARSANGAGTKPYLFMLMKIQLVPVRKVPKLKAITRDKIFSDL
tara:strand:- start:31774 stop:32166 length:393 start_codon:yes stop_codon:yes gene_type:complete